MGLGVAVGEGLGLVPVTVMETESALLLSSVSDWGTVPWTVSVPAVVGFRTTFKVPSSGGFSEVTRQPAPVAEGMQL